MNFMGYTFNVMTLMALSLVVGLLVDDAIVVRENIFRKLEAKMDAFRAAELGTTEVMLAVIATTMTIISVFFPIGMLSGVIGKLFQQFGYTVIFAMLVSLFDALTVAPFLSAYFAGDGKKSNLKIIVWFERFQDWLEEVYARIMNVALRHPLMVVLSTVLVFLMCIVLLGHVKQTFFPVGDRGEFTINIEMPAGTSLQGTRETLEKIEDEIRKISDIDYYGVTVGTSTGDVSKGSIDCFLKKKRKLDTFENKKLVRKMLDNFKQASPTVDDPGNKRSGSPFVLIVSGNDLKSVEEGGQIMMEKVKQVHDLIDVDSSMRTGKPEFRVNFDDRQMQNLGVSSTTAGLELRYNVTGALVGLYKEGGYNYDIRARLKPEQRDIQRLFHTLKVPNTSGKMVNLSSISRGEYTTGSAQINRRDKAYIVKITANLAPDGGVGSAMKQLKTLVDGKVKLPAGVSYSFSGDSENFAETAGSVLFALVIAIVFIYLVLSSLYESFVTPMTILLAIPPALTGALLSLFITGFMLDIFSMIGMIMLMGLVTKNSILLVDNAVHNLNNGMDRQEAILAAGKRRLRPILMTTFAMLAGMLPLALGIGEAAKFRQGMGIAIMGGIIVSTLITLISVPAVFEYIDRFRAATEAKIIVRRKDTDGGDPDKAGTEDPEPEAPAEKPAKKAVRKKSQ
jgi:HAE1 family hydrophobic/amphiphilic exporter-1